MKESNSRAANAFEIALLFRRFVLDVFDDVADRLQFLRVFVWHFYPKLFFKGHHELDDIERVCTQSLNERLLRCDLFRVHAELLDDDILDLLFDRFVRHKICSVCVSRAWKSLQQSEHRMASK